jgi:hypothetical protein
MDYLMVARKELQWAVTKVAWMEFQRADLLVLQ